MYNKWYLFQIKKYIEIKDKFIYSLQNIGIYLSLNLEKHDFLFKLLKIINNWCK